MNNKGFTLIEVLVSSTVLIIATTWIFSLFRANLFYIQKNRVLVNATYLAQEKMEEMRGFSFDELKKINHLTFNQGQGYIRVEPAGADLAKIEIGILNVKRAKLVTLRSSP